MTVMTTCTKCGAECALGVNAISTSDGDVCDSCANVRRGFANTLLPDEREALKETLTEDLRLRRIAEFEEDFAAILIRNALEDAK